MSQQTADFSVVCISFIFVDIISIFCIACIYVQVRKTYEVPQEYVTNTILFDNDKIWFFNSTLVGALSYPGSRLLYHTRLSAPAISVLLFPPTNSVWVSTFNSRIVVFLTNVCSLFLTV